MTITTVKVSEKGQIAIPKTIREKMKISKGDRIILFQYDSRIMLEKSQNITEKMKDELSHLHKLSEKSLKKVWDNKEDEIWNDYLKK